MPSRVIDPILVGRYPAMQKTSGTSAWARATTSSRLDNLDPFTVVVVQYPFTGAGGMFWSKGAPKRILPRTTRRIRIVVDRASSALLYETNDNVYEENDWNIIAVTFDLSASAGSLSHIYTGLVRKGSVSEPTYANQLDGSGAATSDAGQDSFWFNNNFPDSPWAGRMYLAAIFPTVLDRRDVQWLLRHLTWQQWNELGPVELHQFGRNGRNTEQYDLSGNRHHAGVSGLVHSVGPSLPRRQREPAAFVFVSGDSIAQLSHYELEVPDAPRRGQVSHLELEAPDAPRRAALSWLELETPFAPVRGAVSWFEAEVPLAPRRAQLSWAELEVPELGQRAGQLSWLELELPDAPRQAAVSWFELETPDGPRAAQLSWFELEVPTAPRRTAVSHYELEVPTIDTRVQVSWFVLGIGERGIVPRRYPRYVQQYRRPLRWVR